MTQSSSSLNAVISDSNAVNRYTESEPIIDRIVQKIYLMHLPGLEHFESYMHHKWRMNRKPHTLRSSFQAVRSFLTFYVSTGKSELQDIVGEDLEVYVEHEQDRGIKITTVKTRLGYIWAFLRFLVEQDIIGERILRRKIRLRTPNFLPRAIAPSDVRKILAAVKETRDRALVLVLLRTGMRIGEVLGLKMQDLDVRDKKIRIYEGEKNSLGRVVYLSDDSLVALRLWLKKRDKSREYLFYGLNRDRICYSSAWNIFAQYLRQTGLQHKGYSIHSLRHTFASELLNAGMRLECLQLLLGHSDITMTRRYARLTDRSREEEYFRAMEIIEQGGIHGVY